MITNDSLQTFGVVFVFILAMSALAVLIWAASWVITGINAAYRLRAVLAEEKAVYGYDWDGVRFVLKKEWPPDSPSV